MDYMAVYQYQGLPPILHRVEGSSDFKSGLARILGLSLSPTADDVKNAFVRIAGDRKLPEWERIVSVFCLSFPLINIGEHKKVWPALQEACRHLGRHARPFQDLSDKIKSLSGDLLVVNSDGRIPGPLYYPPPDHGGVKTEPEWRPHWELMDRLPRPAHPDPAWFQRSSA
jgi:hypothetical protein